MLALLIGFEKRSLPAKLTQEAFEPTAIESMLADWTIKYQRRLVLPRDDSETVKRVLLRFSYSLGETAAEKELKMLIEDFILAESWKLGEIHGKAVFEGDGLTHGIGIETESVSEDVFILKTLEATNPNLFDEELRNAAAGYFEKLLHAV